MHRIIPFFKFPLIVLSFVHAAGAADGESARHAPLLRAVDLDIGESAEVRLCDGTTATVKLVDLHESVDSISGAVRRAEVGVEVNGRRADLVSATYHLPVGIAGVLIDCPITRGYYQNTKSDSWGLKKAARLRLWPAGSPLLRPGTFQYPARQRWFATATQMANVPTFVDAGDDPSRRKIYYHSGLDIGGAEGMVDIVAATDGLVVSAGLEVLEGHKTDTPVQPRYDVVYLLDARGWYYRYSHLKSIDKSILPGRRVRMGDAIGVLGKEGGSGGWSHLHFEIKSRQPSGAWGTQEGYAFLWQAYLRQYQPKLLAVARPHQFVFTGESARLDASKSWTADGGGKTFKWTFSDGTSATSPVVERSYAKAGVYSEIVEVRDGTGHVDYDFGVVHVIDRDDPERTPPTVHAAYAPTFGIHPGDPVTFKARSFRTSKPGEIWNFGDGSPEVEVRSDGNADQHAPDGYATTTHRFKEPGHYIVSVRQTNQHGLRATHHLHVEVEPEPSKQAIRREGSYRHHLQGIAVDEDGCYGNPKILLKANPEFNLIGRYEFDCSPGVTGGSGDRFLVASGKCSPGTGCTGKIMPAVADEEAGLRILHGGD